MTSPRTNLTAAQIQNQLQVKIKNMDQFQQSSNYVEAQKCRIAIQQLKKDYEVRKLSELEQKQLRQTAELSRTQEQQSQIFNKQWDKKFQQFYLQGQKNQKSMDQKHEKQVTAARADLQQQTPTKLKQSSQLLNLRKMQQHMAKQKNYVEAQRVKQRCIYLQKQQKQSWMNSRAFKIQTAINKLKQKQQSQLSALQKKIKQGLDQLAKNRKQQENLLLLKYSNMNKQLKMQQDKQILSCKGHFRTKGGSPSSPQINKSKTGFK